MTHQLKVSSTFDITLLQESLKYWVSKFEAIFPTQYTLTDFNSIHSQLLDPTSEFRRNKGGINFILYQNSYFDCNDKDKLFFDAIDIYLQECSTKIMIMQLPDIKETSSKVFEKLGQIQKRYSSKCGLYCFNKPCLQSFDIDMNELASIPFIEKYYFHIGTVIFRKFWVNLNTSTFKVFIMDCDHTLWDGILNEVGEYGLNYSDSRYQLRKLLKEQVKSGRLLCINSANDEEDVKEVFRNQTDQMVLSENDITLWKVNWKPKYENIQQLAEELNLGLDSFVFIDDDHANIGICREIIPQVLSLRFDCQNSKAFIDNLWLLDKPDFVTKEDQSRGDMYKANLERKALEKVSNGSYISYLNKLSIDICVREMESKDIGRVSQLSNRSNRFNATTIRMTEEQVEAWSNQSRKCYVVDVADKFGSYGLCGCMFITKTQNLLCVDNFILSCRVLNKGVDVQMLSFIASNYTEYESIILKFVSSAKNNLVEQAFNKFRDIAGKENDYDRFVLDRQQLSQITIEKYFTQNGLVEERADKTQTNVTNFVKRNSALIDIFSNYDEDTQYVSLKNTLNETSSPLISVETVVVNAVETLLGCNLSKPQKEMAFMDLGMTSVQIVQFVASLRRALPTVKERIDITLPFNHPSIKDVTHFLLQSLPQYNSVDTISNQSVEKVEVGITSMACKLPGGIKNPMDLWQFLKEEKNARKKISRWSSKHYPSECGSEVTFMHCLEDIAYFDNRKFNISDAEAALMDPQQKLVLEVAYEALYRSDINLTSSNRSSLQRFKGQNIGVFVALSQHDWPYITLEENKRSTYAFSGKTSSIASGRISFTFGLTGPSLNVDTACSSSLVALNMAKRSIEDGDCDAALVVGVNLNLHPETFVQLSRAKQLSSDGLCKSFDNNADGFARGEGCGAVLLQTVSSTSRSPLAIVKGVALNNDGCSSSLAAPNGAAQQDCLKKGLSKAHLTSTEIDFIETHGAGTKLGDAIEFQSLKAVFSDRGNELALGAVKSNVGHLEAAAGIVSIIKSVLVLLHSEVPPNLHLKTLNDCFQVSGFPVSFCESTFHLRGKTLRAGISSFGMSGTNGFAILEGTQRIQSSIVTELRRGVDQVCPKCYSWKYLSDDSDIISTKALHLGSTEGENDILAKIREILKSCGIDTFLPNRNFFELGLDSLAGIEFSQMLLDQYEVLSSKFNAANLIYNLDTPQQIVAEILKLSPSAHRNKTTAVIFTGQGSQYFGMGAELYKHSSVFKEKLDEVADIYDKSSDVKLLEVMFQGCDDSLLVDTKYAQICIFAFEYALFTCLLDSRPDIQQQLLLGHSVGEFVAATVSGILSLDDAVRLVKARGEAMSSCSKLDGVMYAVKTSPKLVRAIIADENLSKVSIAAINGPESTVISGSEHQINKLFGILEAQVNKQVVRSQLDVSHAFHSSYMQDAVPKLTVELEKTNFNKPSIPIVSELYAKPLEDRDVRSTNYWVSQLLGCVNFHGAVEYILNSGVREIIEVGPTPKLVNLIRSICSKKGLEVDVCSVIKKNVSEVQSFISFFGETEGSPTIHYPDAPEVTQHVPIATNNELDSFTVGNRKFNNLYQQLFDESTLLKRMEDRLFEKLLNRWESPTRSADEVTSLETVSLSSKPCMTSYILPNSKKLVFVFDGENKLGKSDLFLALEDMNPILAKLREHGSILFRNFGLKNATDFREVLSMFEQTGYQVRDYLDGISPRSQVVQGVYTSTEYAPNLNMAVHNEMSYNPAPPDLISFFCQCPPKPSTGRTPLASSAAIFQNIPTATVKDFKRKGLRYIVNSPTRGKGAGVCWQQMYETEEKKDVETICNSLGIETRWNEDGSLTTFRSASATRVYQGKEVWFNHAHLFHPTDLPKSTQEVLRSINGTNFDRYPKFCFYGDGSAISEKDLEKVRETQQKCQISFDWKAGDLLLVDNFQVCHGRQSFDKTIVPKRRILASMLFK